jgi:hypothetical protein
VLRCHAMPSPVCTKGAYLLVFHGSRIKRVHDWCTLVWYIIRMSPYFYFEIWWQLSY